MGVRILCFFISFFARMLWFLEIIPLCKRKGLFLIFFLVNSIMVPLQSCKSTSLLPVVVKGLTGKMTSFMIFTLMPVEILFHSLHSLCPFMFSSL